MNRGKVPDATSLTRAQYSGWACCWCGRSLRNGGALAGRARGSVGAHVMDVDVYECMPGYGCRSRKSNQSGDR